MLSSGAVRAAIAFASNLVLVRFIAPAQFGEFALALAAIGLFLSVISLRMGVHVIRLRDEELAEGRAALYWNVLAQETLVAGVLASAWLVWSGSFTAWTAVLLAGLLSQHLVNNSLAFYERQQHYSRIAALEGGSAIAAHALAVALVLLGAGPAALYLRELALGVIFGALLASVGGLYTGRLRWLGLAEWRQVLAEARGIWLEGMLEGAFQRATVLLAGALGSTSAVGFFYQARRLAVVPQQLLKPLTDRMALNWLSRSETRAEQRRLLLRLLGLVAAPLLGLAAACVAFADPIVPLLFGDAWRPAAELLVLMAGVVLFFSLFGITRTFLIATRRMRYLLLAQLLQWVGLALPLAVWWVGRPLGVELVALGLSVSCLFAFVTCLVCALRHTSEVELSPPTAPADAR